MVSIRQSDLDPIVAAHPGNRVLARALEQIASGEEILRALGRYIHFNATFGGGVANLAGEIAVRQDLFRDPDEEVEILADRSMDIAADIFFAAIDEFGDRSTPHRGTHRSLAQATLKAAGQYFGCDAGALNRIARPNAATVTAVRKVRDGYGVNQEVDAPELFRAIGFHLSSEILADEEFRLIDSFLRAKHGDLVDCLEGTKVEISGRPCPAYVWIRIHTSVEADHFDSAVRGANQALHYFVGPGTAAEAKGWMIEGFRAFAAVQAEFMAGLTTA
jgi:hypothetical protein